MKKNEELDIKYEGNEDCLWDITVLDNKITFFSNGFYLKEQNENVIGYKYMVIWNFKKLNDNNYYFINQKKEINKNNNIFTLEGPGIKVNKSEYGTNEIFELIDIPEDELNDNEDFLDLDSSISPKILDLSNSSSIDISSDNSF